MFLLSLCADAQAQAQVQAPGPEATLLSAAERADARAQAVKHFQSGVALYNKHAWIPALAEFLESKRLFPTRTAVANAAQCLQQLDRPGEAIEQWEEVLRFPRIPDELKDRAQRQVALLRLRVGALYIDQSEPGASIIVNGHVHGEYPALAPVQMAPGTYLVRLYKEGFEPFKKSIEVTGGQIVTLRAPLAPLVQAGRLRVEERRGKGLDVVVDAVVVGKTPWEGPVASGEHTVLLQGAVSAGTLPTSVTVQRGVLSRLTLAAEPLDASVRVVPIPVDASIAVDGLFVSRGVWEGRLRPGLHAIKVVADGYFPAERKVRLSRGGSDVVAVELKRDPYSVAWRRPPRLGFELVGAIAVGPTLGSALEGGGDRSVALGGNVLLHAGYDLWNGLGFGISVGYMSLRQEIIGRAEELRIVGYPDPDQGTVDDTLKLRALRAGAWAAFRLPVPERFALRMRLGAGVLVGSASDRREGVFRLGGATNGCPVSSADGNCFSVGPVTVAPLASWATLGPEVRFGVRLGTHVELSAGVEALVLVGLSQPTWEAKRPINGAKDGYGNFGDPGLPGKEIAGAALVFAVPSLGVRYDF